jgi:4a-hydroxytetrahydrobiopterin dehydratase
MTRLAQLHCVACRKDAPTVTEAEIAELRPQIPDWELVEKDGIPRLERVFRFRGFSPAVGFSVQVALLAESEGHHPDLELGWGRVAVALTTHAAGGLTDNDFILAAKLDRL